LRVEHFLEGSAARGADRLALVCGADRLTYGVLADAVTRAAQGLLAIGVGRGDRVVIHLDNSPEAVIALFAVLTVGGVFVLANPTMKADKLAFVIADCGAVGMVAYQRRAAVFEDTFARTALRAVVLVGDDTGAAAVDGGP
jgi:acyl-CoA synthetase (AMP-forming)/AMP-acid ligase II